MAGGTPTRSYVSGNYFMELDKVAAGFIKSFDGGAVSAEVINEPSGPDYFTRKHIGQPKYEDITIQIGFSMSKHLYDWIQASWKQSYMRKSGMFAALDYNLCAKSFRTFTEALITETTVPACDGSSKEPAYMTVKFAPETTRITNGDDKKYTAEYKQEQKMFLPSNFRLDIKDLVCTKVNKIDSFTIKQTAVTDDIGDARDMLKEPGKLEFPNLKISLAEVTSESWVKWHEEFVIRGNNDSAFEKAGALYLLNPNREKTLATIEFKHMGIFKLTHDKAEANSDQIRRVTAELYVEEMEFKYA